jgi:hypothetical protein
MRVLKRLTWHTVARRPFLSRHIGAHRLQTQNVAAMLGSSNSCCDFRMRHGYTPPSSKLHFYVPDNSVIPSLVHISSFSTNAQVDSDNNSNVNEGEKLYKLAMEALTKSEDARKAKEEKLLREQYDAMNKQRQRTMQREQARAEKREANPKLANLKIDLYDSSKDKAAGAAVVRTIVKQSQPNVKVDQHTDDDEAFWQTKAREHMEEAALRYGHASALVRLGNDALENEEQSTIFDKERMQYWMEESPVALQRILNLSSIARGDASISNADYNRYDQYLTPYQQLSACLYKEAGKRGSAEGWYNLGHLIWECIDIESESTHYLKDEAFEAFYKSLKLDDADAMYFLAVQYLSNDEEDTSEEALHFREFLSNALEKMNPETIELIQSQTVDGFEVDPIDVADGDELYLVGYILLYRAALQYNHGPALHHLAILHHEVTGNDEEFRRLLSAAAATGYADALFLQGHSYFHGRDGYLKDDNAALENFLAAAENGNADAMVSAGAILHRGVKNDVGQYVIERDMPRAFDLYQQAGEMGSQEGWRNVVHCYATGQGVPKCVETAKHIAETMLRDGEEDEEEDDK